MQMRYLLSIYFIEQSRRDDLESLGYVLLYLINGTLPWGIYLKKPVDLKTCGQLKNKISLEDLCDGLPGESKQWKEKSREMRANYYGIFLFLFFRRICKIFQSYQTTGEKRKTWLWNALQFIWFLLHKT